VAYRTFCTFKIAAANTPQPLVGSWITLFNGASGAIPPLRAPGSIFTLGTAANAGNDASQIFVPSDPLWLIDPNGATGANIEPAVVGQVTGNTLTLAPQTTSTAGSGTDPFTTKPHVAGTFGATAGSATFMLLNIDVNNIYVQPQDGSTGPFYIGNQINFTSAFRRIVKLFATAAGVQPISYSAAESSPGNPFRTSELWIQSATAGDEYSVSFNIA
jgi:hypothetical protein